MEEPTATDPQLRIDSQSEWNYRWAVCLREKGMRSVERELMFGTLRREATPALRIRMCSIRRSLEDLGCGGMIGSDNWIDGTCDLLGVLYDIQGSI